PRVSAPVNTSLNWFMPAFVNSSVGSACGTSELEGTISCPCLAKNSRNVRRTSAAFMTDALYRVVVWRAWSECSRSRSGLYPARGPTHAVGQGHVRDRAARRRRAGEVARESLHAVVRTACVLVVLLASLAHAGRHHARFEPTDLEFESSGHVEVDLQ